MAGPKIRLVKDSDDYRVYQATAARWAATNAEQKDIATKLDVSEATVSRLLKDNPFLRRDVFFDSTAIPDDDPDFLKKVDSLAGLSGLSERLTKISANDYKIEVEVCLSTHRDDSVDRFTEAGAPVIAQWLSRSNIVGVCWGGALARLVLPTAQKLKSSKDMNEEKRIKFIPMCGIISTNPDAIYYSSTNVALLFNKEINSDFEELGSPSRGIYNLNCIPMRHPKGFGFNEKNYRIVQEYMDSVFPDHKRIFRTPEEESRVLETLPYNIDTLVTGIGGKGNRFEHLDEDAHFPVEKRVNKVPLPKGNPDTYLKWKGKSVTKATLLKEIVCGDIGGVLLPKKQPDEKTQEIAEEIIDSLNERLATLRASHLEHCGKRPEDGNSNGVIAIAAGTHKADVVIAGLEKGYISRLLIDSDLATALQKKLG